MTNKYYAVKVKLDGHVFDSKAEAKRYGILRILEKAGEIERLTLHPQYHFRELMLPFSKRTPFYEADFSYAITYKGAANSFMGYPAGKVIVEDVKSAPTMLPIFKMKCALMKYFHRIEVHVYDSKLGSLKPTYFEKRKVNILV